MDAGAAKIIVAKNRITGEVIGQVRASDEQDVRDAVARARDAQKAWASMGVPVRNEKLGRLIGVMLDRADEIASAVSAENGKPRVEALGMLLPISGSVKLHTAVAKRVHKGVKASPTFFMGSQARIFYEPLGVVGFILPWNFPFESGIKHMIPALAAGNAVVQKPSPLQPMVGELIKSLFADAGLPEGLVQMVHGGAETGRAIVDTADALCFIGSTRVGRMIAEGVGRRLIPHVLELGGNDPAIVCRDADLDFTARGLVNGACFNAGQVCNGIERIYAHQGIASPLTERILAWVKKLKLADGASEDYDIGPMTWPDQEEVYRGHTEDAVHKGAELLHGGRAVECGQGRVWMPTVLANMNHDMLMMREETFGPFLPIMPFESEEQALSLANDSRYGLAASVWTRNIEKGQRLCRQLRAGHVVINNAVQSGGCATLPFGGSGDSGMGRLSGEQAFFLWTHQKSRMICPKTTRDLWMPYGAKAEKVALGLARGFYARGLGERLAGWLSFLFHNVLERK